MSRLTNRQICSLTVWLVVSVLALSIVGIIWQAQVDRREYQFEQNNKR